VSAYDKARESWDFPHFAKAFPRNDALDALVVSFAAGNYGAVRDGVPKLVGSEEDEAVKRAAEELLAATKPDPSAKMLVLFAATLLVFLTAWWVLHDGPGPQRAPQPVPTVEYPK
jgi:hypothetical protein